MQTHPSLKWSLRAILLIFALVPSSTLRATAEDVRGVPTSTVEQLATDLRHEGFQWKFLGRRIEFNGTVISGGSNPRLLIEGMEKGKFDTTALHNVRPDMLDLKPGDKVRVSGMIVDQWYAVWQMWCYTMTRAK